MNMKTIIPMMAIAAMPLTGMALSGSKSGLGEESRQDCSSSR